MKVNNLNCKYLEIESSNYKELVTNGKLVSLTIEGQLLDGGQFSRTLDYPPVLKSWYINNIPITDSKTITEFIIVNIFTGEKINILDIPFTIGSVSGIVDFQNIIAARFLELFGHTVVQNYYVNYDNSVAVSFNYTITDLPYYLSAYSLKSNYDGVVSEEYFIVNSTNGIALSPKSIIILPEFFDLDVDSFTDNLVHFKLILRTVNNVFSTEETCFFIDCTFKCLLPSVHNFHCIEEGINLAMLHYSLTQASNCKCNCEKMIEVFRYLSKQLGYIQNNIEDCGC